MENEEIAIKFTKKELARFKKILKESDADAFWNFMDEVIRARRGNI